MKPTIKFTLLGLTALALAALPLQAAESATAADGKAKTTESGTATTNRATPFRGKLASKTATTITVGTRTFEINAETKLQKDGKTVTLADAVVGDEVGGSYVQADGKLVAKMVRFGPKADAAAAE